MLGMPVLLKVCHTVEVSFALTVQQHLWKLLNKSLTQGQLYNFSPLMISFDLIRWDDNVLAWGNDWSIHLILTEWWPMNDGRADIIPKWGSRAPLNVSNYCVIFTCPDGIRTYGLIATDAVSESEPEAVFLTPSPNAVLPDSTMKRLSAGLMTTAHMERKKV